MKNYFLFPVAFCILLVSLLAGCSQVITYPGPVGEEASSDFTVNVDGKEVFVYKARVSAFPENQIWPGYQRPVDQTEQASFCYYDTDKAVKVEIVSKKKIDKLIIRPLSKNIHPVIEGDKITFTLSTPCQLAIEVNDRHHALHLFANQPEDNPVKVADSNVIYFGPGIHRPGIIEVKDGQTVYIAGGAVVHGLIKACNVKNVTIKGRGILDASTFERGAGNNIRIENCENVTVDGVILKDPPEWSLTVFYSHNISINNVKLIGFWRYNADGIDVVNSHHVKVKNSFVRAFDDCIVLKGLNMGKEVQKNLHDIHVDNCVIWNDWGRAFEIGAETMADSIYRCSFRNSDIIHYVHFALDIQNGNRAHVFDVNYENIRIEDPIIDHYFLGAPDSPEKLAMQLAAESGKEVLGSPSVLGAPVGVFVYQETFWSKDTNIGKVSDIRFKDILYTSDFSPRMDFKGYDAEHTVSDITLENVTINGKKILNLDDGNIQTNEYVKNIILTE